MLARGEAAFSAAIRFASASIIRCRSADLVEVHSNFRLTGYYSMRRAQQCRYFARSSAAQLPSLAPHDSKARLLDVSNRRDSWRSHVHRTHTAQRAAALQAANRNGGVEGQSPSRSLGGQRGPFSHAREWPPFTRFFARRKGLTPPRSGSYRQSYLTNS